VLARMRWFGALSPAPALEESQYRTLEEGGREVLVYYADHPSPLYVPPMYAVVTFTWAPYRRTATHFESSFDGCE